MVKKKTSILLDAELWDELKILSIRKKRTISECLRSLIQEYIKRAENEQKPTN